MLELSFEQRRAAELLAAFSSAGSVSPKDAKWTTNELLMVAGVCLSLATTDTKHQELREQQEHHLNSRRAEVLHAIYRCFTWTNELRLGVLQSDFRATFWLEEDGVKDTIEPFPD